jgi:purine-nucleoside phosphorylase
MEAYRQQVSETAEFLRASTPFLPRLGLLLGTGLGHGARGICVHRRFDYRDLPHFPASTVISHAGELLLGTLAGCPILAMKGRFHLYEGYSALEVTFPIRVMQELGVRTLVLGNAAGGLARNLEKGDIMVITDHVNLTGHNPLAGPNIDSWGPRFPDMTRVYDPALVALVEKAASEGGFVLRKGVYAGLSGPSLETPAETRLLCAVGCAAVGFSTVMEAIAGVHGGMSILGLSVITNINDPDHPEPASVPDIIRTAEQASEKIALLAAVAAGSLA